MSARQDFNLKKGETFNYRVVIRDDDLNYLNLTDYTFSGLAKYTYCNTGYLLNLNPTVYSITSGSIDLIIPFTGTTNLPVTRAPYALNGYKNGVSEEFLNGFIYIHPNPVGTSY